MSSRRRCLDWLGFPLQPCHSEGIVGEEPRSFLEYLGVVVIDPSFLLFGQQACVDQILAVWDHGDVLESKERLVSKGVLGVDLLDDDDVLNPNTIAVLHIVPGLIGNDIPRGKGDLCVLRSRTNADRALVDV